MADTQSPGPLKVPDLQHDEVYRVRLPDGRYVYRTRDELERSTRPPAKPERGSDHG